MVVTAVVTHITKKDLQNIARLAKLDISNIDQEQRLKEFQDVLGHIDTLKSVDTTSIKLQTSDCLGMHDDTPHESLSIEKALQNAIDPEPPFFAIPKFMAGDK